MNNNNPNNNGYNNKQNDERKNPNKRRVKNKASDSRRWIAAGLSAAALSALMYGLGYNAGTQQEKPTSLKDGIIMSDLGEDNTISPIQVDLDGLYTVSGRSSNPQVIRFIDEYDERFPELTSYLESGSREDYKELDTYKNKSRLAFYNFYLLKAAIADALNVDDYTRIHIEYGTDKDEADKQIIGQHINIRVDDKTIINAFKAEANIFGDVDRESNFKEVLPNYSEVLEMINAVDNAENNKELDLKDLMKQLDRLTEFLKKYRLNIDESYENGPKCLTAEERSSGIFYKIGKNFSKIGDPHEYINQIHQRGEYAQEEPEEEQGL